MKLTQKEIREVAAACVSRVIVDAITNYPAIDKAIAKTAKAGGWIEFLVGVEETIADLLLTKFGSSD